MTSRRQFLVAGAIGALAPVMASSQLRRLPRIGVLHVGNSKEPMAVQREPFERGLREHGWVPGADAILQ